MNTVRPSFNILPEMITYIRRYVWYETYHKCHRSKELFYVRQPPTGTPSSLISTDLGETAVTCEPHRGRRYGSRVMRSSRTPP